MINPSIPARWALAVLSYVTTPGFLAAAFLLCGSALLVAGVYVLAGTGWALIAAAVLLLAAGLVMLRGVIYGE